MIDLSGVLFAWMGQLDEEDFKEEQNLVARLVHMLVNPDPEEMYKVSCVCPSRE